MSPAFRRVLILILAFLCAGMWLVCHSLRGTPGAFSSADLWTAVVGLSLTLGALLIPAVMRGNLDGLGAATPWALLFFVMAWLVGLVAQLLLPPELWFAAPAAALILGSSVLVLALWLWFIPMVPVHRLKHLKSDPAALDAAVEKIVAKLRTWNPRGRLQARRQAQVAITVASVLSELRRWNDVSRSLESVPLHLVDPVRRALLQASRAVAFVYLGERRLAWDAIQDANKHAGSFPAIRSSLAINAELIASLDGPAAPVLMRLEELGRPAQPLLQRGWLLARANALAASGDADAARASLLELARISPDGLDRAVDLHGPASELARELRDR